MADKNLNIRVRAEGAKKAKRELKWKATSQIEDLVKDMVKSELSLLTNVK